MRLWDWVVLAHGAPGADAALIQLQDEHGQCVSFLLWGAWSACEGRPLSAGLLAQGARLARRWEGAVTMPIRAARRALKPDWPGIAEAARLGLRARVKSDELDAERLLLEALEALTPDPSIGKGDMAASLQATAAAWAEPPPAILLDGLVTMFEALNF